MLGLAVAIATTGCGIGGTDDTQPRRTIARSEQPSAPATSTSTSPTREVSLIDLSPGRQRAAGTVHLGNCAGGAGAAFNGMVYFDTDAGEVRTFRPKDVAGEGTQRHHCTLARSSNGLRVVLLTEIASGSGIFLPSDGVKRYMIRVFKPDGDTPVTQRTIDISGDGAFVKRLDASAGAIAVSLARGLKPQVFAFDVDRLESLWDELGYVAAADDNVLVVDGSTDRPTAIKDPRSGRTVSTFIPQVVGVLMSSDDDAYVPGALFRNGPPAVLQTSDLKVFDVPQGPGGRLTYSDGRVLYSDDYTLWVYDIDSGRKLFERKWPSGQIMTTNFYQGRYLYMKWGGQTSVVDVDSGNETASSWETVPLEDLSGWTVLADDFCSPYCDGLTAVAHVDGKYRGPLW